MSLISNIGNWAAGVNNDLQNLVSGAATAIKSVFGGAVANLSSLFDGGFVGIDEAGLAYLQDEIKNYCNSVQKIVDDFREDANVNQAYKGAVAEAVQEFVSGTKKLLTAYVSNVMKESVEAGQLFQAYKEGTTNISKDVKSGADEIRKNAQSIKFDSTGCGGGAGMPGIGGF